MPEYTDILYSVDDAVAMIAINRPKSLNAFRGETVLEMQDAIERAGSDRTIGVLVLTGVGTRAFCAGGDVKWEAGGGLDGLNFKINRMLIDCPKPVIARVNGYAIGGGNHIAYYCDFTIAADHAVFGQNGPRVGSPAAGHIVAHSASILGHKRAREMWMVCRRYSARQMLEWGLVNAVVPMEQLDEEVATWCREILALSPTCLKIHKVTFRKHMEHFLAHDNGEILAEVAPGYFESGEQQEGAAAFLEKRAPDFSRWR